MIGVFASIELLDPRMLWLLVAVFFALWILSKRSRPHVPFAAFDLLHDESATHSNRRGLAYLPLVLNVVGLVALVVSLARPIVVEQLPDQFDGIDVMLVMDMSSSMAVEDQDGQPSRKQLATAAAAIFADGRENDRIGLVSFARYPDLICPLTLDHRALKKSLLELKTIDSKSSEDATGIGTALAKAADVLAGSDARSRVIVLLTDGAENVATTATPTEISPTHAAQLCEKLGVRVHVIVAGRGRVAQDGSFKPIDTTQVEFVAEKTKGRFFRASDRGTLEAVFEDIDSLETALFVEPKYRVIDFYLPFLVAGVVMILASRILRATVLEVAP